MNEKAARAEPEDASNGKLKDQNVPVAKTISGDGLHPVAEAINKLLHSVRDIESLVRIYVPLAERRRRRAFKQISFNLGKDAEIYKEDDQPSQVIMMTKVLDALRRFDRLKQSDTPRMLRSSLFLGLFSAFDIFTGELFTAIYAKKPELFERLNRSVLVSELLQYQSFEELKAVVLQEEIESFRRQSYVEQFEQLGRTFEIELTAFERWPQFIECAQRRNLITHCGGMVSEQYINICGRAKYEFPSPVKVGDKLELDTDYLISSCELMMEVGLKLGQTLWRKIFPTELATADEHLTDVIYVDCLRLERWNRAVVFGEFAVGQKKLSTDVNRKIFLINYAIGLRFSGNAEKARELLGTVDWSGAAVDFKLADAVLRDAYDEASEIMRRAGKAGGELLKQRAYHEWPLFHEFRKTPQFLSTYEAIYGYPFAEELQRAATKTQEATKEELEKTKAKLEFDSPETRDEESSSSITTESEKQKTETSAEKLVDGENSLATEV